MFFSLLSKTILLLGALLLVLTAWFPALHAQAKYIKQPVPTAYEIKAAYLYNFARSIYWPANAFDSAHTPFGFCILGQDEFAHQLQQELNRFATSYHIDSRRVEVYALSTITHAQPCHILFVAQSEQTHISDTLDYLRNQHKPILTVSDIPRFVERGGMIMFYINQHAKIRIALDLETLAEVDLIASNDLFDVSDKVYRDY